MSDFEAVRTTTTWAARLAELAVVWRSILSDQAAVDVADVGDWEARLASLRELQKSLVADGDWRGGPRTLLAAIGLQYRELPLTAGLAWLLRSDGHHGLGSSMLDGLLLDLGIAGAQHPVRIEVEETRDQTRADLVLYGPDWTVMIEAKVYASEQDQQLDRLHRLWRDEPFPTFVFLTRGLRPAQTAVLSQADWRPMTWARIANIARSAVAAVSHPAPGVRDYLTTLEAYHSD